MSNTLMDERFSAALRIALVEHVRTDAQRTSRRRLGIVGGVVVGLAIAGGGAAAASQLLNLPGSDVVEHLAAPVEAVHTGSAVVELGEAPAGGLFPKQV